MIKLYRALVWIGLTMLGSALLCGGPIVALTKGWL